MWINNLNYQKPSFTPDKNGNIILCEAVCFGPAEVYQYGINKDNQPYYLYEWLENDFYADENGTEIISFDTLIKHLRYMLDTVTKMENEEWILLYQKAIEFAENLMNNEKL